MQERYAKEISPEKENLILLNKADLLGEEQRLAWARFFEREGARVVFWSALAEGDRLGANPGVRETRGLLGGRRSPAWPPKSQRVTWHPNFQLLQVAALHFLPRERLAWTALTGVVFCPPHPFPGFSFVPLWLGSAVCINTRFTWQLCHLGG